MYSPGVWHRYLKAVIAKKWTEGPGPKDMQHSLTTYLTVVYELVLFNEFTLAPAKNL